MMMMMTLTPQLKRGSNSVDTYCANGKPTHPVKCL